MPDDASSRRLHLDRQSYAERFARGDSYGLLLALLVALYLLIAAEQHRNLWGRFIISVVLGLVLLLAFHTSHVRSRAFRIGIVLVVIADLANLVQAATGRHGGDGSTFIMFAARARWRRSRSSTGSSATRPSALETILGVDLRVRAASRIAFAGIYGGVNEAEPTGFFAQEIVPNNVDFLYFSLRHHHHRGLRRPHRRHRAPGACS